MEMMWIGLALLFTFLGFAVTKLKWHFLISGYNTMSKEQKENVDIEGLSKLIGWYLYGLAALFIVTAIVMYLGYSNIVIAMLPIIIVSTIVLVFKAQKYNVKGSKKNTKRSAIISVITLAGVGILFYFLMQPTEVIVTDDAIEIKGMYGDTYEFAHMTNVTLLDALPSIAMRTNGSAVGSKLEGHFKFDNGDKAKLFVDKSVPPFIQFMDEGNIVIFNLQTAAETENLYEHLKANTK